MYPMTLKSMSLSRKGAENGRIIHGAIVELRNFILLGGGSKSRRSCVSNRLKYDMASSMGRVSNALVRAH